MTKPTPLDPFILASTSPFNCKYSSGEVSARFLPGSTTTTDAGVKEDVKKTRRREHGGTEEWSPIYCILGRSPQ